MERMTDSETPDGAQQPSDLEPTEPSETSAAAKVPRERPAKWKVTLVVTGIVVIQIANYIASASLAVLVNEHPLWLVLMQPTTKNLLLVTGKIWIVTFLVVAILRRQVPHILWFFIGRWYGQAGLDWVSKRFPDFGQLISQIEDAFPKWGPLICALYPHPVVCAMAGASKMRFVPFLIYTFAGIILFVSMARIFGDWLKPVTDPLLNFSQEYVVPLTILTVAITAYMVWKAMRAHKLESVETIERELEEELVEELQQEMNKEADKQAFKGAAPKKRD